MTGPEHYGTAERLLEQLRQARGSMTETVTAEKAMTVMAEAQVHATLALAAATAGQTAVMAFRDDINDDDVDNWHAAAGPKPRETAS